MDNRIRHAEAFKLRCKEASIPKVLHACKFTLEESSNPAKQMAVCCAYEKAIGGNQRAPPVVIGALIAGTTLTVSPLTNQTGATPSIAVITVNDQLSSPPLMPTTPGNKQTRPRPKLIRSNK
jgi:hypothetical protein